MTNCASPCATLNEVTFDNSARVVHERVMQPVRALMASQANADFHPMVK